VRVLGLREVDKAKALGLALVVLLVVVSSKTWMGGGGGV
jgi:hypothetical protein